MQYGADEIPFLLRSKLSQFELYPIATYHNYEFVFILHQLETMKETIIYMNIS